MKDLGGGVAQVTQHCLNEPMVNMLVCCRGKYILSIILDLFKSPRASGTSGEPTLLHFEDLTSAQVKHFFALLQYLLSPDGSGYILEVEGALALQKRAYDQQPGPEPVDGEEAVITWDQMWAKVFTSALTAALKSDKSEKFEKGKDKLPLSGHALAKFLPKVTAIGPKAFLDKVGKKGKSSGEAASAEANASSASDQAQGVSGQSKTVDAFTLLPTFEKIYTMHELGTSSEDIHSLNILSLRASIESHLMTVAMSKSSTTLLQALRVDSKNAALLGVQDCRAELASKKVYAFGTVSTEWTPKSLRVSCIILVMSNSCWCRFVDAAFCLSGTTGVSSLL